jgi:hypothetical protein
VRGEWVLIPLHIGLQRGVGNGAIDGEHGADLSSNVWGQVKRFKHKKLVKTHTTKLMRLGKKMEKIKD